MVGDALLVAPVLKQGEVTSITSCENIKCGKKCKKSICHARCSEPWRVPPRLSWRCRDSVEAWNRRPLLQGIYNYLNISICFSIISTYYRAASGWTAPRWVLARCFTSRGGSTGLGPTSASPGSRGGGGHWSCDIRCYVMYISLLARFILSIVSIIFIFIFIE